MRQLVEVDNKNWDLIIVPKAGWWDLKLKETWRYRDLLLMFVKRDFVAEYKQTILGPLWFLIQPVIATLIFTIIFGKVAKISTDGLPQVLFYMSGIVGWGYFADCLTKTSATFTANAQIFGKVFFPRIIVPLSIVTSNLLKFSIQFLLFLSFLLFYLFNGAAINPNSYMLLTPLLIIIMAGLGLGLGMIISSLTTKYRDLRFLVGFGVQLLMYATPVVYPLSVIPDKYRWLVLANPMTSVIESFKFAYLGAGTFDVIHLSYSAGFMIAVVLLGMLIFNRVEKNFMDTV